jgi:hypothetical protein
VDFDIAAIRAGIIALLEFPKFSVLPYRSKRSGKADEISQFVWAFKQGVDSAVQIAVQVVGDELDKKRGRLLYGVSHIVCAPPHNKGFASPSSEFFCEQIANRFSLTHIPRALERTKSVRRAATAPRGQRPTYNDHVDSINYAGPSLDLRDRDILLFDDVLTSGDTSDACRDILNAATGCRRVVGLFLARTQ